MSNTFKDTSGFQFKDTASMSWARYIDILTSIENDIISAAKEQMTYLKTVDTYAGELEDALKNILPKYPCMLVAFDGGSFNGAGYPANFYDHEIRFSVILIDKNLRGDKERRHGTGQSIGTYNIISDTLILISGKALGLSEIAPIDPVSITSLLQGRTISVYEIIFKTSIDFQVT